jgi:hypothetical protein
MKRLASPGFVAAACGLIVVTNLVLLTSAGWNRRSEPLAELTLTERELPMPGARQDEGAGWELSLVTTDTPPGFMRRIARLHSWKLPPVPHKWLDREKLLELGFQLDLDATDPDATEHYANVMPRRVYVVVEYDGDAWNRWISGREEELRGVAPDDEAEEILTLERTMRSRLFMIDAGLNAGELQRRYGDREGHVVLAALIRPRIIRQEEQEPTLSGTVQRLVVNRIHVSTRMRQPLAPFLSKETWGELERRERNEFSDSWPAPTAPRYEATLAVGHRNEPWLAGTTEP